MVFMQGSGSGLQPPCRRVAEIEPVPRPDTWPSQRWRCNALVEKNGTGKASRSIYAEKKTFFGATEEGEGKALVCELGTGKAKGERIEETSPWMSAPTYEEAMARQRQFMHAHEYLHPPTRKTTNAASSSNK
jgi:hypothetical protein|tara:strand:+ start:182 stop:577 length:396 start_codon:yes stop_codon:yes gene_type:complete